MEQNWGRKANADELPDLRYCSDIFWGYWFRGNLNVKNLRVYGAQNIVNDITVLLAARALKETGQTGLIPWPGHIFDGTSDGGKALIGERSKVIITKQTSMNSVKQVRPLGRR